MSNSIQVHPGLSQRIGLLQIQGKGQAGAAGFEYLSTEGLLVYCQSRLRDLDTNIKGMMAGQKAAIAQRSEVARVTNELSVFSNQGPKDAAQFDQAAASVRSLIEAFPKGDPRRAELEQLAA